MTSPVLSACISANYPKRPGVLREVRLEIAAGEILGLVGESGSGKSTVALALMRLLEQKGGRAQGSIVLNGRELMLLREREMRQVRGRQIGLVLQSPASSLNPAMRIGTHLEEAWRAHARGPREECRLRVQDAMRQAGLPAEAEFLRRYPSQISVGQAQRVLIALAILHRPELLIADEPTSALDVITQSEILALFRRLNRSAGTAVLFISHDLPAVAELCDRIAILHAGSIVECAPTEKIFLNPEHDYTRRLVMSLPRMPQGKRHASAILAG